MQEVKSSLLPNLENVFDNWKSNYPSREDPAGYFGPLIDALVAYATYFQEDVEISDVLSETKEKVADEVSELETAREDYYEERRFDLIDSHRASTSTDNSRRIFDDIDAWRVGVRPNQALKLTEWALVLFNIACKVFDV